MQSTDLTLLITHPSVPPILRLPPELIDHLLTHVPPQLLQRTALSLLQVFPDYGLSTRSLWVHLIVHRASQIKPLWQRLKEEAKKDKGGMTRGVKTFSLESWSGDADIINNAMRCLPDLRTLLLNIGTNYAPEHLEEMFEEPRMGVQRMEMRFRPYVEQASYYQFLKGSYFDTAIETLYRRWPEVPSFTHLSIVQDLPPRASRPLPPPTIPNSSTTTTFPTPSTSLSNSIADLSLTNPTPNPVPTSDEETSTPPTSIDSSPVESKGYTGHGPFPYLSEKLGSNKPKSFAQPIVFFDIKCLAKFGASPVSVHLTHLRLRVPSRDLAYVLLGSNPQSPSTRPTLFPSLRYLDISTTNVRLDSVFTALLKSYARLEHLVIDHVNLFGFHAKDKGTELCKDLGGVIVSAGLSRGKERERLITAWEVAERTRAAIAEMERQRAIAEQNQGVSGNGIADGDGESGEEDEDLMAVRQAEAAAEERERAIALARSRRGHRSAAMSTFSIRDRPARASRTTSTTPNVPSSVTVPPPDKLYMVLPPLPTMRTLSIGGEAHHLPVAKVAEWEAQFHAGWRDGLGKILGWATHVGEKYERAKRKAEEWQAAELNYTMSQGQGSGSKSTGSGKGKSKAPTKPSGTKPPTDIRLYRFPSPSEYASTPRDDPKDPLCGLVELHPQGRDYLLVYKDAIADGELYANDYSSKPPCVLCTVPDCEGPLRRGADGERVDGRGGMGGKHREGCGHELGREIWGWEGVKNVGL